ncbi:MAG: TrkA C-terminal domain-containing protein [Planctomycetota bacterium]
MLIPVIALLATITISLICTRIATVALSMTGMSVESARFQARSAFTGVGFTSSETEAVVRHPVRRKIIMLLMLLGNAGLATAVASVMLTISSASGEVDPLPVTLLLVGGIVALWLVSRSKWVEREINLVIAWALRKWTDVDVRDYSALLQLENHYAIAEMLIGSQDYLVGRSLIELRLNRKGVLVLGLRRQGGAWIGAPSGEVIIRDGDTMVVYGRMESIRQLDRRKRDVEGLIAHHKAAAQHQRELREELTREEAGEAAAAAAAAATVPAEPANAPRGTRVITPEMAVISTAKLPPRPGTEAADA